MFETGDLGLRKRITAKSPPQLGFLSELHKKHVEFFLPTLFKRYGHGRTFLCRANFSKLVGSLFAGLWTKPLLPLDSPKSFFPAWYKNDPRKYALKISKDAPSKNLSYNVVRVDVALVTCDISPKPRQKADRLLWS